MAYRFLKGDTQERTDELPELNYIYEHIIAKTYNWDLEKIRALDYYDFQVHLRLCLVSDRVDNEIKLMLAGGSTEPKKATAEEILRGGGPSRQEIKQEFDPSTGSFQSKRSSAPQKIYQKFDPKTGMLIDGSKK